MKNLVCVHGFLGNSDDFKFFKNKLDHHVWTPQISMDLKTFSLKAMAENILEQLPHNTKFHFWGYSMGGRILLELYNLRPEIFESLILESSSPGMNDVQTIHERKVSDQKWADLLELSVDDGKPVSFLKTWYDQSLFDDFRSSAQFRNHLETRADTIEFAHSRQLLEASPAANPDHFAACRQIAFPVLVLLGEFDSKYRNLWSKLIANFPNFKLKIVPRSGHVTHLENPEATLMAVKEFL